MYSDATPTEISAAVEASWQAYQVFRKKSLKERAALLRTIADELEKVSAELIDSAHEEAHLTKGRLDVEFKRNLFQLTSYAEACELGTWLDVRIDTADANRQPPKPDIRKMLTPIGPVVVFGSSNFPFAYSTAGGDTACALAAGCPVIIKAHPGHSHTSELTAKAVHQALERCGLPKDIFIHLHGASFEVGKALVLHPLVKAVGFTGSLQGGRALFDLANSRKEPIPVFAEMGSVNPVFLLPQKMEQEGAAVADMYAASITQSVGQFCTNPGLLVGIEAPALDAFVKDLGKKIGETKPEKMLHAGIAKSFREKRAAALAEQSVTLVAANESANDDESIPTLATVPASVFLANPKLHEEVFGPYSLLVRCTDMDQMLQVARQIEGQLTATLMATAEEAAAHHELLETLQQRCGRFVFNGVPTGVEVCLSMHHGGPYPATTDSRFTAVGADGIRRFARPVSFQNWPDELLPPELQKSNPLELWRTVNGELTKAAL